MKASGLGATGCTGLVCLAASFFRLTLLLSNMSCMDVCFCSTFSTWSCMTRMDVSFHCMQNCFSEQNIELFFFGPYLELLVEHGIIFLSDGVEVS